MNYEEAAAKIQAAAPASNVVQFHATPPMQGRSAKAIVLFELSTRAHAMHRALLDLSEHPVWSLISPEAMRRMPLHLHEPWRRSWRPGELTSPPAFSPLPHVFRFTPGSAEQAYVLVLQRVELSRGLAEECFTHVSS